MGSAMLLMDLLSISCGFYCMYTWLRLLLGRQLFPNGLLVPKEKKVSDCSDEAAYLAYIRPRLAVLAFTTMIYGIFALANSLRQPPLLPYPWDALPWVGVMGVLIWYAVCSARANREYFGM